MPSQIKLFILFVGFLASPMDGVVNMLLFWGTPTYNTDYCKAQSGVATFEDCMNLCLGSQNCMLAYGTETDCSLCDIYTITTIEQTTSAEGQMVGIKIDQQSECPAFQMKEEYTRKNGPGDYNLTFSEPGPNWTVDYGKRCIDQTWRMFQRPVGPICLTVIRTGNINREGAVSSCEALGTGIQIGGMQSKEEYDFVRKVAKPLVVESVWREYTAVWLSGIMKNKCATSAPPADCIGLDGFEDFPYQDNFNSYQFPAGYPNYTVFRTSYYQKGLWLMMAQNLISWDGMVINVVDNLGCNGNNVTCSMAVACAGPPT